MGKPVGGIGSTPKTLPGVDAEPAAKKAPAEKSKDAAPAEEAQEYRTSEGLPHRAEERVEGFFQRLKLRHHEDIPKPVEPQSPQQKKLFQRQKPERRL